MTLVNVNPTISEDYKKSMHVDHKENDPTCNYYEREKYDCKIFHVTKSPLFVLKLLLLPSSYLHMLEIACLDNLFSYKMPMHWKYVRLKCVGHMFYDAFFVLQFLFFTLASLKSQAYFNGYKERACWEMTQ